MAKKSVTQTKTAKPKIKPTQESKYKKNQNVKKKYFEKSKELILKHKLIFVQDISDFLGISLSTFYEYFPSFSDELEVLKGLITENRIALKVGLRQKMYKSKNSAETIALYKLIASDEERRLLSTNYTELSGELNTKQTVKRVFQIQQAERKRGNPLKDSENND